MNLAEEDLNDKPITKQQLKITKFFKKWNCLACWSYHFLLGFPENP